MIFLEVIIHAGFIISAVIMSGIVNTAARKLKKIPLTVLQGLFFGIIMVITLAIGHNTPPVGLCLFVACDIGGVKLERLVKEVAPLVLAMVVATLVMNCLPQLILFLPDLLH